MEEQFDFQDLAQSENGHTLSKSKSVDVFNALNLYSEELGARYEQEGYNPFGEGFVLTEDYANEILENKRHFSFIPMDFTFNMRKISRYEVDWNLRKFA